MSTIHQSHLEVKTPGRGLINITDDVCAAVSKAGIDIGVCHVFLHHTSASLILCENSDPDVCGDLERFFTRLVPDGDLIYRHTAEGPDDMSAHVRAVLTANSLTIPVTNARPALGRWQGIFVWEHRNSPYKRQVTVTVQG